MAKFIVDLSENEVVHVAANIQPACEIEKLGPRVDIDSDYTKIFAGIFTPCPHCYESEE